MDLLEILKDDDAKLWEKVEEVIYNDSAYSNGEYLDEITDIDYEWVSACVTEDTVIMPLTVYMNVGEDTEYKQIHKENVYLEVTFGNFTKDNYQVTNVSVNDTSF